jgi:hypothetical protein
MNAWAQGGLVGLVPLVLVLVVGALLLAGRSLRPPVGGPPLAAEPARLGALITFCIAVAHLSLEYDLSYLPLVGLMALCAGVAVAPLVARPTPAVRGRRWSWPVVVSAGVALLSLAVSVAGIAIDPRMGLDPWTGPIYGACGSIF